MKHELIFPASTDQWLGLRKGRVTSSPVAGALGMNRHQTPLEAWLSITGRSLFEGNKATIRGTRLEQPVLDYPTREGRYTRAPAPFVLHANGWAADSTDCLYADENGVMHVGEGKTAAQGMAVGWGHEGTDEIPENVLVQSYWHLGHWPAAVGCVVPVLIGGFTFEFREYYVPRDNDLIGELFDLAEKFYRDHILLDVPPAPTADDRDGLAYLWPKHVPDKWLPPSTEIERLTRAYVDARAQEKAGKAMKEDLRGQLAFLLGDAEGSRGAGWKVTLKHQGGGSPVTNWEALAKELSPPETLIKKHTTVSKGFRSLRATLPAAKTKKGEAA